MLSRLLLPLTLLLAACAANPPAQAPAGAPVAPAAGMVSAADPRASEAGVEVLRAGGSATDAALAVMLALTVVEPQSSGIGGGGFMLHHDAQTNRISSYDGRETAPMAAGPQLFLGPDSQPLPFRQAVPGGRSVGVPGNIRLMQLAHERHGRLAWAQLFAPAIRLARDGFVISPRMHRMLSAPGALAGLSPAGRALFFAADGQPKPVGTRVVNPELAALLEQLAARGADHYYTGPHAQAVVNTVRTAPQNPGQMTAGDLAAYDAKERPALCGTYRGYRICGMGPPSSGGTTVYAILKQLERFDLEALGPDNPVSWHLMAESMRLAYADRDAYVADPDFVPVPVAGLMSERYLADRSRLISPTSRMDRVTAGTPPGAPRVRSGTAAEVPSTSHFVTMDRAGNVVSYTSTIEGPWGSGLTVAGYYLNNELTDFSFVPERGGALVANRVEGGKRPRSSMSPTIVYDPQGRVRLAVGAAGGTTIIAQVAKAIIGVIDWNLSAQEAIALPQIVALPERFTAEAHPRLEPLLPALRALGHPVATGPSSFKANAVEWVNGRVQGAADPRSEGAVRSQ